MESVDLSKIFKSYSVKEWISKDGYLPIKADINVSLEILPQDMGETPESADMDKMTINMSEQVKYYDYGKSVTIQLPPEAQNAEEMPYGY
jgi:predicted AlkP superfamily phosphohydrolase/phosphomutase